MRKIADRNRIKDRERIFYDDYRPSTYDDVAEVHLAYRETVTLIKKLTTASRTINVSGVDNLQGRMGGRRAHFPTGGQPIQTPYGGPDEEIASDIRKYEIPALVDINGEMRVSEGSGISLESSPKVYFSVKILKDMGIEIDDSQDRLEYSGDMYRFVKKLESVFYLGQVAEYAYEIEST